MLVASGTPDRQPEPRMYVCPGCKTRIPLGTETSSAPDNCPKCRRRLFIPTLIGEGTYGRVRDPRDRDDPDLNTQITAPSRRIIFRTLLIATLCLTVGLALWQLARVLQLI
jgi:DNA-directed RNA polymerase subunit RPC12/RpoP